MRYNIFKKSSTRYERIVYEVLKELRIPFKHRWYVEGVEIDFIVGAIAIEIDGHEQNEGKNNVLARNGYTPIHLNNLEVTRERIIKLLHDYKIQP